MDSPRIMGGGREYLAASILVACVAQAACFGLAAWATRNVFNALAAQQSPELLWLWLFASAGAAIAISRLAARILSEKMGYDFARSLRLALYESIALTYTDELRRRRLGDLGIRFVGDLSAARGWAGAGIGRAAAAVFVIPAAIFAIWLLDDELALAAATPVLLAIFIVGALGVAQEKRHRRMRAKRGKIASSMLERVSAAPELDLLGRTKKELASLDRKSRTLTSLALRRVGFAAAMRAMPDIGIAVAGVFIFISAAARDVGTGEVAAAISILALLSTTLKDLVGSWDKYCGWVVAREKCLRILSVPRRDDTKGGFFEEASSASLADEVDTEMSIRRHAGLERAGVRIKDAPQIGNVALISASAPILAGSLRRALTLGCAKRPRDHLIVAACRDFELDNAVARLGGLDGHVAEGGSNLSEIERYRLLITRAALQKARLTLVNAERIRCDRRHRELLSALAKDHVGEIRLVGGQRECPNLAYQSTESDLPHFKVVA